MAIELTAPLSLKGAAPSEAQAASALLPTVAPLSFEPVRGDGVWLFDARGRRVLDFYGGHAVALLGYRHPRLLATLSHQATELFFQSLVVRLDVRERAAARLAAFAPAGLDRVFFVNSGAEANENALRLAFRHTGRRRVVAVEGGFHGRTAAAAAVTAGSEAWYAFPAKPFEVTFVPHGDVAALEAALENDAAALILEPVQGMAGAVELGAEYLRSARELTQSAGAFLIFDEVQCGMGRTGYPFAAQRYGVTPDLLTVAKGLAGGFPAGALIASDAAAKGLKLGDLGTTFGGGPLACALVEATIDAIEEEGVLERVRRLSAELAARCVVGPVTAVQGAGYLLGLRTSRPAKEVLLALLERGILVGGSADPQVVRLLPPLVLEASHVDLLVAALAEVEP